MDRERFNTLLTDPTLVTDADIRSLNEYRKKYPYFQSLYVVIARALKHRNHPKTDAFVKKTSVYSVNPRYLNQILERNFTFPEKTIDTKPKLETVPEIKPEAYETSVPSEIEAEIKATKARIEALLAGTEAPQEEVIQLKKAPTSQVEIIEKFIKDEPSIERQNKLLNESPSQQVDLASKALKEVDAFETETLAKLMAMQGKPKKAINIYQKLSLKFPEKSTYFAARIEEIKSKKNV